MKFYFVRVGCRVPVDLHRDFTPWGIIPILSGDSHDHDGAFTLFSVVIQAVDGNFRPCRIDCGIVNRTFGIISWSWRTLVNEEGGNHINGNVEIFWFSLNSERGGWASYQARENFWRIILSWV